MSQSVLSVPGNQSLATMPIRIDRTTSVWAAEVHDGQHWRRIHSREPWAEANRQAAEVLAEEPGTVVLLGAGLGYLPEALLAQNESVRVVVVEPVSALAEASRARRDWTSAQDAGRIALRTWDGRHEPGPLWQLFDRDEPDPVIVVQPALANAFPRPIAAMRDSLARSIFEGRANAEARRRQAGRYLLNTLGNLDAIAGSADAGALEGALIGSPAVVVAAGPSLDRNLAELAAVADRVAIIAVDTALRPLLNAGVQPPLAVALDPTELNARHLLDLPPHEDTWLAAEPSVAPEAVRGFASRLLTFRVADHHPWPWLASQGLNRHVVRVWGSVLTAALDLAIHTGADPIVFVGADLAYTNGQPYCRNATWERSWAELTGRGAALDEIWRSDLAARQLQRVSDIDGRESDTTAHLVAFRDWLIQRMGEVTGRTFINATGAGILHGASIAPGSLDSVGAVGTRAGLVERLKDLTTRSQRQRGAVAWRLAGALMILPSETRDRWEEFGRETTTADDLDAAMDAAQRSLGTDIDVARESAPAGMLPAAERAARLHAALTGRAVASKAGDDDLNALLDSVMRASSSLRFRLDAPSDAFRAPISLMHDSTASARHELERIEDRLARMVRADARAQPAPARLNTGALVRGAAEPLLALHEWLSVAAAVRPSTSVDAPATVRWVIEQAIDSTSGNSGHAPHADAPLEIVTPHSVVPLEADPAALFQRLPGLAGIVSPALSRSAAVRLRPTATRTADPALAVFDCPIITLHCDNLVCERLGPAGVCSTLDPTRALVTPFNAMRSVALGEDGRSEPYCEWPVPVLGAFAIEGAAAVYAWRNEGRQLLYRSQPDADALIEDVPFRPMRGTALDDGSSIWCAVEGGLWQWRPGSRPERIIDTPAPLHVHIAADGVIVERAFLRLDETLLRRRAKTAWLWPLGGAVLSEIALGAEGQCTGRATRDGWTAAAFPFADVVIVDGPGSLNTRLAVAYPLTTAWVGRSLLVCNVHGHVLLFRRLIDRLSVAAGLQLGTPLPEKRW